MSKAEQEAVLKLKISLRKRKATVVREYVEASARYQEINKLPAMSVSFDSVSNLKETMARLGGYMAALEYSLEQIGEKL
jgi:hypothetical protein